VHVIDSAIEGYDVIGDVHGCADKLEDLLAELGYRRGGRADPYRHEDRQAIFVGDLIDRGDQQLRVLRTVKAMVDAGSAQMVLGNHEFNAMAYATASPAEPGKYLRPHDDPDNPELSAKNTKQHQRFLEQVDGEDRAECLRWFWTLPMWLDLGDIRVVHACWHPPSIELVRPEIGGDRFSTVAQLARASTKSDPLYTAVEILLKGPEISLTAYGQPDYRDKDGHVRSRARARWWDRAATTLREIAEVGGNFTTADGKPYPVLPAVEVRAEDRSDIYTEQVPVFYGHYWRSGEPQHLDDWTDYTACVDFSAVKGGELTAYRWSGEKRIKRDHYVQVGAQLS
jgi:hypothetical protein